ncbi:hypothetical protein FALB51S_04109 [Frigidibacter albus]
MINSWIAAAIAAVFFGVFLAVAALMVPACGLNAPPPLRALSFCETSISTDLVSFFEIDQNRLDLERRIAALRKDLALRQCQVTTNDSDAPDVDETLWNDRDLSALEGCWSLDQIYRVVDERTREVTEFNDWTICFDAETGLGSQVMRSTSGTVCEGEIPGSFNEQGQLVMQEPNDLPCSNDSSIFQRVITCDRTADGGLSCQSFQPRGGGWDRFSMNRQ